MATTEELARAHSRSRRKRPKMKLAIMDDEPKQDTSNVATDKKAVQEYKHSIQQDKFKFAGHEITEGGVRISDSPSTNATPLKGDEELSTPSSAERKKYLTINTENDLVTTVENRTGLMVGSANTPSHKLPTTKIKYLKNTDLKPLSKDGNITADDFEIVRNIGRGSQGAVELVRYKASGELLARKSMQIEGQCSTSKHIITEFKSLFENDCLNVIKCKNSYFKSDVNKIYFLLEYMDCGSLEDVLQRTGRIPEHTIQKILVQLLNGLLYLHKVKKIVHRDIKPANILVNSKGLVKFCDFGMAGHYNHKNIFTTVQGSRTYMSPERLRSGSYSFDCDIWSLGIMLAELALGEFPLDMNQFQTSRFDLEDVDVVRFEKINTSSFSQEFVDLIESCMQVDPSKRPSAQKLFHSAFIKKYAFKKPSLKRWIRDNYYNSPKKS